MKERVNRSSIAQSRDAVGKIRTEKRPRLLMISARKERHGSVEIADPDLGGAGGEIEGAFFVDLGWGVRSGKDFDANRRSSRKRGCCVSDKPAFLSLGEQDDVGDPDLAVASKDGLLNRGELAGVKMVEEIGNSTSSLAMVEARGWRHDELACPIDFEAFRPIGEGWIAADFEPAFGGGSCG
jgi:hypothetical protein